MYLLKELPLSNNQIQDGRGRQPKGSALGVHHADEIAMLRVQIDEIKRYIEACFNYRGDHPNEAYCITLSNPHLPPSLIEKIGHMGNFQRKNQAKPHKNHYLNIYNLEWHNHPNFSWKEQYTRHQNQPYQPQP